MSPNNKVIYTGMTNDLIRRVYEHKHKLADSFTKKYNVTKLVHFEDCTDPITAISREKQIKGGSRNKKIDLISKNNPDFVDLHKTLL